MRLELNSELKSELKSPSSSPSSSQSSNPRAQVRVLVDGLARELETRIFDKNVYEGKSHLPLFLFLYLFYYG